MAVPSADRGRPAPIAVPPDSEAMQRLLCEAVDLVANAILVTDTGGSVIWANQAFTTLTGYETSEILGQHTRILKSGEQAPSLYREMWKTVTRGGVWRGELLNRRKDGSLYDEEMTITPLKDATGAISHFVAIKLDITKRKQAEEAATSLGRIVDDSLNEVYIFDAKTYRFVQANRGALANTGYSMEELADLTAFDLKPEYDLCTFQELTRPLRCGEEDKTQFETVHRRKDASLYPVEVHLQLSNFRGAQVYIAIVVDITERKEAEDNRRKMEAQVRQSQRLESLGVLAGGIAHDFNNILTAILGFAHLGGDLVKDAEPLASYLSEIEQGGRRARDLVRQILSFSQQHLGEQRPVKIGSMLDETLKLIRAVTPATIDIRQRIEADCHEVLSDPIQIHQVIMNLCTNAYQSMGHKPGTLEVTLRNVKLPLPDESTPLELEDGDYVELAVRDTGTGMDEATLERIFDPFFTTKEVGEGTGLGLSTTHGIVNSLGGEIRVESELGHGTLFKIYLPRSREETRPTPVPVHTKTTGYERILFVDDEASIVRVAKLALEKLGYTVATCSSGQDALSLFRIQPDEFNLIITDLSMPQMSGVELARQLLQIRPETPIILCSGFADADSHAEAKQIGVREVVMKPVVDRDLALLVRRILDEEPLAASV